MEHDAIVECAWPRRAVAELLGGVSRQAVWDPPGPSFESPARMVPSVNWGGRGRLL